MNEGYTVSIDQIRNQKKKKNLYGLVKRNFQSICSWKEFSFGNCLSFIVFRTRDCSKSQKLNHNKIFVLFMMLIWTKKKKKKIPKNSLLFLFYCRFYVTILVNFEGLSSKWNGFWLLGRQQFLFLIMINYSQSIIKQWWESVGLSLIIISITYSFLLCASKNHIKNLS